MVYETNCTEITQDKWRELMKYGRKCSYRLLTARIKRELPELYHALALQFYNPYAEQSSYLQPIITQYFIDNKSEIWLLFLIAHSKR